MRVAAIQTTAGADRDANLAAAGGLVDEAVGRGAELVVLPEYFSVAGTPEVLRAGAEALDGPDRPPGRRRPRPATGSTWSPAASPRRTGRDPTGGWPTPAACSAPTAPCSAVYRKIHLFDVALRGVDFRESDTVAPGDERA